MVVKCNRRKSYTVQRSIYQNWSAKLKCSLPAPFESMQQLNSYGMHPEFVRLSYQAMALESKLLDGTLALKATDRRTAAIDKWLQCELSNINTNVHLYTAEPDDVVFDNVTWDSVCNFARNLIANTIGEKVKWGSLCGSFSGGASTSVKRGVGTVARKYTQVCDCTPDAYSVFLKLNRSVVWNPTPNFVQGNVLFTVPKSTVIDRCACKEPDLNMYCQKAVGDYFRRSLLAKGINLNDQTINQHHAFVGSTNNSLATIDLSSASDSVTTQLVIALLPFEWSSLLLDIRSPFTYVNGEWHENQMVSSMGNACTFELESLIFWALTKAACYFTGTRGTVSVYGDDIICPTGAVDAVVNTLSFCGFSVNTDKSFWDGPFRESCGKHYYSGVDVTPFYVRTVPTDVTDLIHLANSFRSWLDRASIGGILDPSFFELWNELASLVPTPLHGGWDYARRDVLVSHGRRPIARLAHKQRRHKRLERSLADGLFLQWLDTTDRSSYSNATTIGNTTADNHQALLLIVDLVSFQGDMTQLLREGVSDFNAYDANLSELYSDSTLIMQRFGSETWSTAIGVFPEELRIDDHTDLRSEREAAP